MKSIALAVVALFFTLTTLFPAPAIDCERRAACIRDCDAALRRALDALTTERGRIRMRGTQALLECRSNNPPASAELRRCEEAVNARTQEAVRQLEAPAREARRRCEGECNAQNRDCVRAPSALLGSIDVECIPGGAPCFKAVSKVCTQMEGACGDCGFSLCGGGEWGFDSEVPLTVTLVAAASGMSNPRVLAASTPVGNQAVLNVPEDITLKDKEQLYLQFSSTAKPKGAVRVRVHRDR